MTISRGLDSKNIIITEGKTLSIPRQARHRVGALDSECVTLEIVYGRFEENDIERIEDDDRAAIPAEAQGGGFLKLIYLHTGI